MGEKGQKKYPKNCAMDARMVREKKGNDMKRQLPTDRERACYHHPNMFTSEYSKNLKKILLECIGLRISEIKRMYLEHTPCGGWVQTFPTIQIHAVITFTSLTTGDVLGAHTLWGLSRIPSMSRFHAVMIPTFLTTGDSHNLYFPYDRRCIGSTHLVGAGSDTLNVQISCSHDPYFPYDRSFGF